MTLEEQILRALSHPGNDLSDLVAAHVAGIALGNPAFAGMAAQQETVVVTLDESAAVELTIAPEDHERVEEQPEAVLSRSLRESAAESPEIGDAWGRAFLKETSPAFKTADEVGYSGLPVYEMTVAEQLKLSEILEALEVACKESQERANNLFTRGLF